MERATGIEPAFSAWEADVLPLNYARGRSNLTGCTRKVSAPLQRRPTPGARRWDGWLLHMSHISLTVRSEVEEDGRPGGYRRDARYVVSALMKVPTLSTVPRPVTVL